MYELGALLMEWHLRRSPWDALGRPANRCPWKTNAVTTQKTICKRRRFEESASGPWSGVCGPASITCAPRMMTAMVCRVKTPRSDGMRVLWWRVLRESVFGERVCVCISESDLGEDRQVFAAIANLENGLSVLHVI